MRWKPLSCHPFALFYASRGGSGSSGPLLQTGFPDCSSSNVTATAAFAERRILCPSTSATSPRSMKCAWPLCWPSPLSRFAEPDATVGDGADVDAVRADHLHVLGDLVRGHLVSPCGFTDCAGALGANLVKCLVGLVWHRWASSCCG